MTFRRVIWPLVFPAVVAGSIFTFALTLGDYITPQLVSSTVCPCGQGDVSIVGTSHDAYDGAIDIELMQQANLRADRTDKKETPAAAARWLT